MLRNLHEHLVSNGIPIVGLAQLEEGYRIDFADEATTAQKQQALLLVETWEDAGDRDWEKLESSLRSTALMGRSFEAAKQDLACNAAFTVLYGTITRTHTWSDFLWSLGQLRAGMSANPAIGDFTAEEMGAINDKLVAAGFPEV